MNTDELRRAATEAIAARVDACDGVSLEFDITLSPENVLAMLGVVDAAERFVSCETDSAVELTDALAKLEAIP